jgi:hypothetical protein
MNLNTKMESANHFKNGRRPKRVGIIKKKLLIVPLLIFLFGIETAFSQLLGEGSNYKKEYAKYHYYPDYKPCSSTVGPYGNYEDGNQFGKNGIYCNFGFTPTDVRYGVVTAVGGSPSIVKTTRYLYSGYIYQLTDIESSWDGKIIKIFAQDAWSSFECYILNFVGHPQIVSPTSTQSSPYTICADGQVTVKVARNSWSVGDVLYSYVSDYDDSNCSYSYSNTATQGSSSATETSYSFTPTRGPWVKIIAKNLNGEWSKPICIRVNEKPTQPGTISGTTTVCAGGGQINYYISQVSGATSYTWSYPSGWSLTGYYYSGSDWDVYLTPSSSAVSGNISVKANNSCGSSTERTVYVTVNTPPTAPTGISSSAGTTITSGQSTTLSATGGSSGSGCSYQWYKGGCGSGSVLGTGSTFTDNPTSATTYYVRRVGNSPCGGTTTSCASVTINVTPVPSNDLCTNATTLNCGANLTGQTTVGTTAKTGVVASNTSAYGVWYTFLGDGNQTTITSIAGSGFDHAMGIYSGSCGSLTHIITRDSDGTGGTETYVLSTSSGTRYYVYVAYYASSGSSTQTGTFSISRTCSTQQYTITLSASPSGAGTTTGSGTFDGGTSRTVTATANSGYNFVNWTEGGTQQSTSTSYSFTLNNNRNLVANFQAIVSTTTFPIFDGLLGEYTQTSSSVVLKLSGANSTGYTFKVNGASATSLSLNTKGTFVIEAVSSDSKVHIETIVIVK